MAWIKSHKELERHPKVLVLERYSTLDRNGAIGVLHRFWYWVMDYAEDGNLSKWELDDISKAIGIDANHLIKSGWIDEKPELRVHDWFDYFGEYFRGKYRKCPEKYEAFKRYYSGTKQVKHSTGTRPDKIRGEEIRLDKDISAKAEYVASKVPSDIQKVIEGWKVLTGIDRNDKGWDKVHYPRYAKSAKSLLTLFGSVDRAWECMEHVYNELRSKKLECTIETVVKRSDTFKEQLARGGV